MVALLFLTAPGFAQDQGDAIVSASIADARTLMPMLASDSASAQVSGMIFNGLVKYDKDINLVGDLAESWDILDEGLVIVFHLRKNVLWQDGHPFMAHDVEFTYKKMIDPDVRTPYGGDFERVNSFEVIDDYTIKVTYKEPFAPGLASWGMSIIPKHLLENQDLNTAEFSRRPVGTGPYTLKRWKVQEKIELKANNSYFEHRPYIDRSVTRIIPDESTIFLELQTQGIDSSGLSPLQFSRQTDTAFFKKHYRKFRLPGFNYTYMGYDLSNPKFSDKRVRQALNLAVDKQEIIDVVLLGFGAISTGPFVPQSWAYNQNVIPESFDPGKAMQLMADAGWQDSNNDGWLDKDGRVFEFTLVTNQGNEERQKTAEIIQRRLKDIGIRVTIKVVEWSVFLSEYIDRRDFEAILLGWSVSREPDIYDIWYSAKTKQGEFNFVGYGNQEVDRLLLDGRRTFDQIERQRIYHRIHQLIYEDQPYMFLFTSESLSILHNRFREVKPAPAGIGYNFIDWWVPKTQQKYRISP
ncbi:MAG: peptide-binding protein [Candidatus Omnitrophica bacterium]|nr:peptide-binding protein [Candidatus Omnitrophota bacterium]